MKPLRTLHARLDNGGVELEPGDDVPDDLFSSLGRNIAPSGRSRISGRSVTVPVERFLASRGWLTQALRSYSVDFDPDSGVRELLRRSNTERSEIDGHLANDARTIDVTATERAVSDSGFKRTLLPFQLEDVGHLLALSNGANFSVPGAGKTTVAYACFAVERQRGRVARLLVIAPISAFEAWIEEAAACLEQQPRIERFDGVVRIGTEVLLVNYQRVAAGLEELVEWATEEPTHVILDEAHRMKKGRAGEWGRACLDLAEVAARRDILTGTPAPQHPRDFSALLDFLWPHQATRILPSSVRVAEPPPGTMAAVSMRIAPLFVRTTKSQLGLRDPLLRVELVEMGAVQRDIYEALRVRASRFASGPREQAMFSQMGRITMYLLEAASNPGLLASAVAAQTPHDIVWPSTGIPTGSSLADRVLDYGQHEVPAKFQKLATMIERNAQRNAKTLVWSNFVGTLEQLAAQVLAPYQPAMIHGGVPSTGDHTVEPSREHELHRFRTDPACRVLLANPAAMSEGVSLHHECHDAIYVDRTFNAGQYLQSIDRIHRLGLAPDIDTNITFLVCQETIDEVVDDRVRTKAERLAQMLRDPDLVTMALPNDDDYGTWVDPADMDALLGHLRAR